MIQMEKAPGHYPESWSLPASRREEASSGTEHANGDDGLIRSAFSPIVGHCPVMQQAIQIALRIIRKRWQAVLIHGENGTGKELLARAIHTYSYSGFRPFVEVHCRTLDLPALTGLFSPDAAWDANLTSGANGGALQYSGERTLFLEEISDLPETVQIKLLKYLEKHRIAHSGPNNGTPQIRIISTTTRPLDRALADGRLRPDLYYFLSPVSLHLPPLRDRGDDIALLANHFLQRLAAECDSPVQRFTPDALVQLQQYPWPGNVRELRRIVERLVLLGEAPLITANLVAEVLAEEYAFHSCQTARDGQNIHIPAPGLSLSEGEKLIIQAVLTMNNWNKRRSSQILKISRPRLDRKIEKYGLTRNQNGN